MKTISPHRTTVTAFSSASPAQQQQQVQGFEYDAGEYILSIASPASPPSDAGNASSSSCVAAALSDRSIVIYDANRGQVTRRILKAHDAPISDIQFFPWEYQPSSSPPPIITASQDGTAKVWDARSSNDGAAVTMKLALPGEQALSVSLGYGGTLAAVGTSKARASFFDLRYAGSGAPSGALMGSYVDAHTEEVTKVTFQAIPATPQSPGKTVLATASEDGLIAVHDPSKPSEDAALLSVLNIGAPLRDVGFFGPMSEGLYALTGNETMSVHHWDSAQRVSDVGGPGLRGLLSDAVDALSGKKAAGADGMDDGSSVEYLVGCSWSRLTPAEPEALHLLAGNSEGDGYLFRMDADRITPLIRLEGGHRGCIRDFCWVDGGGGVRRLVTGGEDARLVEWDLTGNNNGSVKASSDGGSKSQGKGGGPMSGRSMKGGTGGGNSGKKGKKKFGSPY